MSPPEIERPRLARAIIDEVKPYEKTPGQRKVEVICNKLHISNQEAHVVEKRMRLAIANGLSKISHEDASVKCFPTFVTKLPNGKEKGRYLALDLGGTNFRVLLVDLKGDGQTDIKSSKYQVPKEVMTSQGFALFDYMAECIARFLESHKLEKEDLKLGFTFSFPCEQTGLALGRLKRWTKGFQCPDVVGKDVCQLLNEAMKRKNLTIEVTALVNDSTGCLLSCAWKEPKCRIGLIVGTGCNACYVEDINRVETWDGAKEQPDAKYVVINTEWGAFGELGELDFILTEWDLAVDKSSLNPGEHIFEKMISGMYMGEIVRNILLEVANEGLLFNTVDYENLKNRGCFQSRHICEVEYDPVGSFNHGRKALQEVLGHNEKIPKEDCYIVRHVCEEVSRRASMILGAGVSALLKKMDYKEVVIAVDGTLFRKHPVFYTMMQKKITQLMGIEFKFALVQAEDGSGLGAAVLTAALDRE